MQKISAKFQGKSFQRGLAAAVISLCLLLAAALSAAILPSSVFSPALTLPSISTVQADPLPEVYFNPASGLDTNDGTTAALAVQTLDRAYEILGGSGIIFSCATLTISTPTAIGWAERITFKRYYNPDDIPGSHMGRLFEITGGVAVTLTNLTIDGAGAEIALEGVGIYANDANATLTIVDCIFTGNKTTGTSSGGAIYFRGLSIDITGSEFTDNTARNGGAIYQYGTNAEVTIENCTFENNSAGMGEGVIWSSALSINITGSVFTDSSAYYGGAICQAGASAELTIENCTFEKNTGTSSGGAIYQSGTNAEVTIKNCTFKDNAAGFGGAIYFLGLSINITGSVFTDSSAYYGGAIYLDNASANLTIDHCTFENNMSTGTSTSSGYAGGAIRSTGISLNVTNSDFIGNTTYVYGGAIYLYNSDATLTIDDCTFENNRTTTDSTAPNYGGGAIYSSGIVTIEGTNFIGNSSAVNGGAIYISGSSLLTCTDCYFEGNIPAGEAGAIFASSKSLINCQFTMTVYMNPVSGDDSYSGASMALPVKTIERAYALASGYDTLVIYMLNTWTVTASRSIGDVDKHIIFRRHYNPDDISGSHMGRLFEITGGVAVTLTNLTIDGAGAEIALDGAGIYANATLTIEDCVFENNTATNYGGAIYFLGLSIDITGSEFTDNTARNGGAIFYNNSNANATLTIENCTFEKNTGTSSGGAIYQTSTNASLTIKNCIFENNSSANQGGAINSTGISLNVTNSEFIGNTTLIRGGAIYLYNSDATLTIDDCTFENNRTTTDSTAPNYGGGAINSTGISLNVTNSNFIGNTTYARGGAIHFSNANAEVTIDHCTFENNSADQGGAIYSNGLMISVTESDFIGNTGIAILLTGANAEISVTESDFIGNAGGINSSGANAEVTIENCIFENNTAASGGAINSSGTNATMTIEDCIFTNNFSTSDSSNAGGGAIRSAGSMTVTNSEFIGNTTRVRGGAIYLYNASAKLTIEDCLFEGNSTTITSPSYGGGAIHSAGTLKIEKTEKGPGTKFIGNSSKGHGGAIWSTGEVEIEGAEFIGNSIITSLRYGGAIYAENKVTVIDTKFINNSSVGNGAAIYIDGDFDLSCINCYFEGNIPAGEAGAIRWAGTTATKDLTGSQFVVVVYMDPDGGNDNNNGKAYTSPVKTLAKAYELMDGDAGGGGIIYLMKTLVIAEDTTLGFLKHVTLRRFYDPTNETTLAASNTGNLITVNSNSNISLTMDNMTLDGAGVELEVNTFALYAGSTKNITVTNSKFIGNITAESRGPAIFFSGTLLTCDNVIFMNNKSLGTGSYGGGAIYSTGNVIISNSHFFGNFSKNSGGAIYLFSENNSSLTITNCTFEENRSAESAGGAVYSSGAVTVTNSHFIKNIAYSSGGAIYIYSASTKILIVEDCIFEENCITGYHSVYGGGAIRSNGEIIIRSSETGEGTQFIGNTVINANNNGGSGGAIRSNGGNMTIEGAKFINNSAYWDGGAIIHLAEAGTLTITDCSFEGNYSIFNNPSYGGGAIRSEGKLIVTNSSFTENNVSCSGGAIFYKNTTELLTIDNCIFSENTTRLTGSGYGGALYIAVGAALITNSIFDENTANYNGGAIYSDSTTELLTIQDCIFEENSTTGNNTAYGGGAIYSVSDILITSSETGEGTQFIGNTVIDASNFGGSGGAIRSSGNVTIEGVKFINNSAYRYGGAIHYLPGDDKTLSVDDCIFEENSITGNDIAYGGGAIRSEGKLTVTNSSFTENDAYSGGAIFYKNTTEVLTVDNCIFSENTSRYGGALYIALGAALIKDSIFDGNTAVYTGGAIYLDDYNKTLTIKGGLFDGNNTISPTSPYMTSGGAAILSYGTVKIERNDAGEGAKFIENTTLGGNGSAICSIGQMSITLVGAEFISNSGAVNGGAIYATNSVSATDCKFIDNIATSAGGAIYINGSYTLSCINCYFEGNLPEGKDGALYTGGAKVTTGSQFMAIIFMDPTSGNDANLGKTSATPVKTINKAYELMGGNSGDGGIIYLMKTWNITTSGTYGFSKHVTIRRFHDGTSASNTDNLVSISNNLTVTIDNMTFDGAGVQVAGCAIYSNDSGAALTITNSTFKGNFITASRGAITFSGSTLTCTESLFLNNSSSYDAAISGAIYFTNLNGTLSIYDCVFEGNGDETKLPVGAIYSKGTTTLVNSIFTNNKSKNYAGAFYLDNSNATLTIIDCLFEKNVSLVSAGAIYSIGDIIIEKTENGAGTKFIDNSSNGNGGAISSLRNMTVTGVEFINNSAYGYGGAIYASNSSETLTIKECYFENNKVKNGSNNISYGGAIYSDINANISNSTFYENYAYASGGAIQSIKNLIIEDCIFEKNKTDYSSANYNGGGAISNSGNLTIKSSLTGTKFIENSAPGAGGAIRTTGILTIVGSQTNPELLTLFYKNTALQGESTSSREAGAIYSTADLSISHAEFIENGCNKYGGAICVTNAVVDIEKSIFSGNYSTNNRGGAINYNLYEGELNITDTTFINNSALTYGGALYSHSNSLIITIDNCSFEGNSAGNGGAIYLSGNLTVSETDFIGNVATYGGAIYLSSSSKTEALTVEDCLFESNTATRGGAIYAQRSILCEDSIFRTNKATGGANTGGAIYISSTSYTATCIRCIFEGNVPAGQDGAIYGTKVLTDCQFINHIYLNINGVLNASTNPYPGNDSNNGLTFTAPVLTLETAYSLMGGAGTIYLMRGLTITSDFGWANTHVTLKRFYDNTDATTLAASNTGNLLTVSNNATVSINNLTFDGAGDSVSGRGIWIGSGTTVAITNSTFKGNVSTGNGGAISFSGSLLTITDCLFQNNITTQDHTVHGGGAIYSTGTLIINETGTGKTQFIGNKSMNLNNNGGGSGGAIRSTGNITITGCEFADNSSYRDGGAIYCAGNMIITGAAFIGNNAFDTYGGAIYFGKADGLLTIDDCNFFNNSARYSGGAIYVAGANSTLTVKGTATGTFFYNQKAGSQGGAIFISSNVVANISNAEFIDNNGPSGGGAIYCGDATIDNCLFKNNIMTVVMNNYGGGAVWCSGSLTLTNSTFIENKAHFYGGGLYLTSTTKSTTIDNCVFIDNEITNKSFPNYRGGAILSKGKLTITESSFIGSVSTGNGGAISHENADEILTIKGCYFEGNNAILSGGGAIYSNGTLIITSSEAGTSSKFIGNGFKGSGGAVSCSGNMTITGAEFKENSAGSGGAIHFSGSDKTLTIEDCLFEGNTASSSGGAIYTSGQSDITITGTEFKENSAGSYGAIYSYSNRTLTIEDCLFEENTAVSTCGAIYSTSGQTSITNVDFIGNKAGSSGGAIYSTSATLIIDNCLFEENSASPTSYSYHGGAIYFSSTNGSMTVSNSEFNTNSLTSNSSSYGGAINSTGALTIENTNFTGNTIAGSFGGAIYITNSLSATDCRFIDNVAVTRGGAIYMNGNYSMVLTRCFFEGNKPFGQSGAVYKTSGTIDLIDCEFIFYIFLDPVSGDDAKDGQTLANAVLTIERAYTLLAGPGVVLLLKTWAISTTRSVGWSANTVTIKRYHDENNPSTSLTGSLITITNGATVTFTNIIFDGANEYVGVNGGALNIAANCVVNLNDTQFKGNKTSADGGGIYSAGTVNISSTQFIGNASNQGGAIYSTGSVSATNTTFKNNEGSSVGGGIFLNSTTATLTITTCTFEENSGFTSLSGGGGIFTRGSTTITDSIFTKNSVGYEGGAIRLSNPDATLSISNCTFTENVTRQTAYDYGGGAIRSDGTLTINGTTLFSENSSSPQGEGCGGAIFSSGTLTITGVATFEENQARYGGAIYSKGTASITGASFEDNTAIISAGAIFTEGNMTIEDCSFTANMTMSSAYEDGGGAIFINGGTTEIKGETSFIENSSGSRGGAIFAYRSTTNLIIWNAIFLRNNSIGSSGGAVYVGSSANLTIHYVEISDNIAGSYGGAIAGLEGAKITINDGLFSNNSARYGGALGAESTSDWNVLKGNFINNVANGTGYSSGSSGGAIKVDYRATISISNALFENNICVNFYGGAIFVEGSSPQLRLLSITNCTFIGNSAVSGGAIYASNLLALNISDCIFENNTASTQGGAIWASVPVTTTDCEFIGNTSPTNGAAIYSSNGSDITCIRCYFDGNIPRGRLGALYSTGTITLIDCNFVNFLYVNSLTGNDDNDGLGIGINTDGTAAPLKNIDTAIARLNGEGTVYLLSPALISTAQIIGISTYHVVLMRGYDPDYVDYTNSSHLFSISGDAEVHFSNVTLDGLSTFQSPVPAIRVQDTAQVYFDSDTIIQNCYAHSSNNTASGILTNAGTKVTFGDAIVRDCGYYFLRFNGAVEINGLFAENFGDIFAYASGSENSFVMNRGTAINGGRILENRSLSMSQIIIKNAYFYNLTHGSSGGAIYSLNPNAIFLIENSIFEKCSSTLSLDGGAIAIERSMNVVINQTIFKNNLATGNCGGSVYLRPFNDEAVYSFSNCEFIGGQSFMGGGIYINDQTSSSYFPIVTIENCLFSEIKVTGTGSAVYARASSLEIINSNFKNNINICSGVIRSLSAAVAAVIKNSFFMTNCNIEENFLQIGNGTEPNLGAGLYLALTSSTAEVTISDCKISGNTLLGTDAIGGGLYISNTEAGGTITISNTQIVGNHSASSAGGAYFDITGAESVLTLSNCTFANNVSDTTIGAIGMPSTNRIGTLLIENCTFEGNASASKAIGELYFTNGTFTGNVFDFNQSSGSQNFLLNVYDKAQMDGETYVNNSANGAGSVFSFVFAHPSASLTVENSFFIANTTTTSFSAPIYIEENSSATAEFINCHFSDNIGRTGGAIYSMTNSLILQDCTFNNNSSEGEGGAVYARNLTITSSTFNGNSSFSSGGAVRALTQSVITHSIFRNNSSGNANGGAIMLDGNALLENVFIYNNSSLGNGGGIALGGTATLTNCHIYSNTASGDGGGVFHNFGAATLTSCNVYSNTANRGGGIYSSQPFNLQSSNVYSNTALSSSGYSGGGLYLSGAASIVTSNIYDNFGASMGGGMVVWTNAMLSNSKIYSNSSLSGGGVLMVYGLGNSVDNVEFTNNYAQFGGAIYQDSIAQSTEEIYTRIVNSTFLNNSASVSGGAIFTNWRTDFADCTFIGNFAETGSVNRLNGGYVVPIGTTYYTNSSLNTIGGITLERVKGTNINQTYFTDSSGTMFFSTAGMLALEESVGDINWQKVSFTDCHFEANISLSGGIISSSASNSFFPNQITITDSQIIGNSDGTGAALQVQNHTVANVTQTYFKDNFGSTTLVDEENGGGVSVGSFATLNLTNCIFHSTVNENLIFAEQNGTLVLTNPNITAESDIIFTRGPVETAAGSFVSISGGTLSGFHSINGGALYIGGSALVEDIVISSCIAEEKGGGVYVSETGVLTFNATIHNCNAAGENLGKAIYTLGSVTMIGGDIYDNNKSASPGGGIFVAGGIFTMNGGYIRNNYGRYGGGIYVNTGATAVINNGIISENSASFSGSGIHVSVGATLITGAGAVISNNTIHSGSTSLNGIGVYNAGTMIMNGGTISGNNCTSSTVTCNGGAIYSTTNSILTIENAIITDNRIDTGNGGGIYLGSGCVAFIKNTEISSCRLRSGYGIIIHSTGAIFTLENSRLLNSGQSSNFELMIFKDSDVRILNCAIVNNFSNHHAALSFTGENNNLYIKDTYVNENRCRQFSAPTRGGAITVVSANRVEIKNSEISLNLSKNEENNTYRYSAIRISNTKILEISDCIISGNIHQQVLPSTSEQNNGGGLSIEGSTATQATIKNTVFENNIGTGNGGGLCINLTNADALVDIIDCSFIGNQSVGYYDETTQTIYGGNGGGIYIGGNATVNFAGRIEITGNLSRQLGGGIYVASGAKMNIRKGTEMIVKDNFASCPTTTQTVTRNGTDYTISILEQTPQSVASNLHLASALSLLEGNLSPLSEIYLTTTVSVGEKVFFAANDYNSFITPADLQVFHSDNPSFVFWLNTAQNAVFSVALQTDALQVIVHDLVFAKKERTLTDDGKYGVNPDHFQVLNALTPYSIEFYATPDGSPVAEPNTITAWTTLSPRFGAIGNYTIYYKVSTIDETVTGSLNLHILGKFLYIEKAPTASLKYGETLSRATFSDWSVKDEDDNAVAGIWVFSQSTTVPSGVDIKYDLTFTPYRANYYEQNPTTSITVSIGFNLVFYKPSAQVGAGGEFYADEDCTASTSITTLGTMLSYLNNGGAIIFKGTYQIGITNDLAQAENLSKTVYFIRHHSAITSPIFEVVSGASATFSAQNGKIIFEGAGQYSGTVAAQAAAILNNGLLDLKTNVIFRNFNSQGIGEAGALGAVITNTVTGTLLLNGCEIYGNTARNVVADGENLGGAIYNAGEMTINNGKFFANNTTGTEGKGGFVFTIGKLMFNGGEIYANTSYLGGGIYVGENGSVFLNGGVLRFNTSTSFGGGAFVAEQGKAFLFGTDIYSNRAGDDGGGIYSDGGTLYNQSLGGLSGEASFEIMQSQNQSFSTFGDQPDRREAHPFSTIFATLLLLMLTLIILNKKSKRKNPFNF